tara:strand:+ start:297 stop:479 length:183 start_codon:yes stop_codon:yes gene_type:complete
MKISKYDLEKFICDNQTKMNNIKDITSRGYKRLKLINQLALTQLTELVNYPELINRKIYK